VLLYGCCIAVRSSRQLERRLHEDLAFRVLAANQTPDHVTEEQPHPVHDAPDLYIPPPGTATRASPRKDGKPPASRSGGLR